MKDQIKNVFIKNRIKNMIITDKIKNVFTKDRIKISVNGRADQKYVYNKKKTNQKLNETMTLFSSFILLFSNFQNVT